MSWICAWCAAEGADPVVKSKWERYTLELSGRRQDKTDRIAQRVLARGCRKHVAAFIENLGPERTLETLSLFGSER